MKKLKNNLAALVLAAALACPGALESAVTSALDQIAQRPLRVGMSPGFPPFEAKEPSGKWVGFDVDIASELAKNLGTELVIVESAWEDLIPSLVDEKIDMIISGMSITLDRAKLIYFTDSYFDTSQVILEKSNKWIKLTKPGLKIGVLKESTGEKIAQEKFVQAKITPFKSEEQIVSALLKGEVQVMIIDKHYGDRVVERDNRIEMVNEPLSIEKYGFGIHRGDTDFLHYLNHFIDYLKYTGRYREIHNKWFPSIKVYKPLTGAYEDNIPSVTPVTMPESQTTTDPTQTQPAAEE